MNKRFKDYSSLLEYVDNNENVENILDYDDFAVVKIDDSYYYYEQGENDCSEFHEVEIVARIDYDINHDIQVKSGEELGGLFDNYCCGEYVYDDGISYLYFDLKGEKNE